VGVLSTTPPTINTSLTYNFIHSFHHAGKCVNLYAVQGGNVDKNF